MMASSREGETRLHAPRCIAQPLDEQLAQRHGELREKLRLECERFRQRLLQPVLVALIPPPSPWAPQTVTG